MIDIIFVCQKHMIDLKIALKQDYDNKWNSSFELFFQMITLGVNCLAVATNLYGKV